mgnify:CR=1 FL=1
MKMYNCKKFTVYSLGGAVIFLIAYSYTVLNYKMLYMNNEYPMWMDVHRKINNDNDKLIKDILSRCRLDSKKLKYPDDYFPIIIMLLLKYHFRIGSHKYEKENKSYGIITLLKNHIKLLEGNKFCIEFVGKKGIINKIYDIDKNIYNI